MDWNKVNELVDQGYIKSRKHPDYPTIPLTIYNYTHLAQFDKVWTPETLACRGLVADDDGQIWARPFPKFFNYTEVMDQIPTNEQIEVTDKLDGSLGILFRYNNELVFATRGSFDSEQAIEMRKIWEEKYNHLSHLIVEGSTYLWEIIYPENRIVISYGNKRDIVLLACVQTETGLEHDGTLGLCKEIEKVKTYQFNSLQEVLDSPQIDNAEGYVVRFLPSNFRCKIKWDAYCTLHRLLTNTTTLSIWECLSKGEDFLELLANCPDEFYDWAAKTKNELEHAYKMLERLALGAYKELMRLKLETRKEQALWIQENADVSTISILFKMLDGKEYSKLIWKQIRPEYQKPFWSKSNEDS